MEIKQRKVLLENEIKELEKLNANKRNELTSIKNRVNEAKEQAEHEIKRIKEESSTAIQKELLTKQRRLTEKNENLEGQIKTKKNLLSEFYTEEKNINNYKELLEEINSLTRKKQDIEKEKKVIEEAIEHRKTTLNSTNLNDKLVEVDILTSILSGRKKQQTILEQYSKQNVLKNEFSLTKENKEDYINYLIAKFDNEHGIHYDFDQMANLLVSLTQSFLTILAGPPGTGKTSSIHKLAYSLGLTNSVESCSSSYFLSVPVGRGWVSSRDVLGFYNSLKEVYQPAKTGLYQFLYQKNEDNVFKIVLLDEANLSSIEHYWSDFLGMCDIDGDKRSIDFGISNEKNRFLEIPKQLRFIATINNDSTTEKLSPRLTDRVPIISLGYKNSDNYVNNVNEIMSDFIGAVDFDEINEIFNIKSSEAQLSSTEDAILKQVLDNLSDFTSKGLSIHVSPRKLNAIKKYCSIMNNIEGLRIQALDYAIAQHILPLIERFGKEFKESLNRLDNKFIELDLQISHKLISDIIDSGDLYGESYSFF